MARVYAIVIFILAQGLCGQVQAAAQFTRDGTILRLANGAITTTFNLTSGEWEVLLADGTVFAANLLCALDLDGVSLDTRQGPPVFSFARIRRPYGGGVRLEIQRGHDRAFLLILTMYDEGPFFLVQVRVADAKGVRLRGVTVPQGKIFVARDPRQLRLLVNGENGGATEIQAPDLSALRNLWTTSSDFCFCALDQVSGKSVVLGALFARASNRIEAQVDAQQDPHALDIEARCYYQAGPGSVETGPWESPPYFFAAPASVFDGLELYGQVAKAWRPEPLSAGVPTGWCSRDTLAARSQDHLLANVDAIQTHRLNDYGLRFVQLDDGWQQGAHCSGNWWPRSERFPLGMRAIADAIQGKRLVPGLWFGPFGEDPPQANQPTLFANGAQGGYDLSRQRFRGYLDQ